MYHDGVVSVGILCAVRVWTIRYLLRFDKLPIQVLQFSAKFDLRGYWRFTVVVKKTFRYSNGFFYYHLYHPERYY